MLTSETGTLSIMTKSNVNISKPNGFSNVYRAKNNAADLDYYNCGDIKLMFIEIFGCFS